MLCQVSIHSVLWKCPMIMAKLVDSERYALPFSFPYHSSMKVSMKKRQSIRSFNPNLYQNSQENSTQHHLSPHTSCKLPLLQPLPPSFHLPLNPLLNRILVKVMLI